MLRPYERRCSRLARCRGDGISRCARTCDFREAVLLECSLRDANIADARFEGADLRSADLGALRLADAGRFRGAVISKRQAADLLSGLGLKVM